MPTSSSHPGQLPSSTIPPSTSFNHLHQTSSHQETRANLPRAAMSRMGGKSLLSMCRGCSSSTTCTSIYTPSPELLPLLWLAAGSPPSRKSLGVWSLATKYN